MNNQLAVVLLGDAGELDLETVHEEVVIKTLIVMQRSSENGLDELIEAVLEVRDGKWLKENVDRTPNHSACTRYRNEWDVEDKVEYLRSKVKLTQAAGRNLALIEGSKTLVHGGLRLYSIPHAII